MAIEDEEGGRWPLARIEEILPSEDNVVRHVIIRMRGKTYKRHARYLSLLLPTSPPMVAIRTGTALSPKSDMGPEKEGTEK